MRVTALLSELQAAGVRVMATPGGDLELDAPRGVLTRGKLTALRQYKAEIVILLSRRCPYCGSRGTRQEQSIKEGLLYVDTFCGARGELVECYVPSQQNDSMEADAP